MHLRDEEIKRIILYLKALGAKVVIRDYAWEDSGEIILEPKFTINVNKRQHTSKTELIMTLLHEAAHLRYTIVNDYKFSDAFLNEVLELGHSHKKIPKKQRKEIAKFEISSLELMPEIAKELNLKVPEWKVRFNMEFDQWVYTYLEKHGSFPPSEKSKEMRKKLKEKHEG